MKKGYLKPQHRSSGDFRERAYNTENSSLYIRLAKVVRVDYESALVDVIYLDGFGGEPKVPFAMTGAGNRYFMGSMPAFNDICLVGFIKAGGMTDPIVIGFLPQGYKSALSYDLLGVPEAFDEVLKPIRPKMRKVYDGELFLSSHQGSDILIDKNILLSNSGLVDLMLKESDQSVHINSVGYFLNTTGVRISQGPIIRNDLLDDPEILSKGVPTYINSEGTPVYIPNLNPSLNSINPYGRESVDDDNPAFIEHRLEIKEYDDPNIPVTSSNSGVDVDSFYTENSDGGSSKPMVVQVLGTLTGNDPVGDKNRYGIILKPRIFADPITMKGSPEELPCIVDSGVDETTSLAAAYSLKFPNSGTAFYVNKQGKYFANLAASSSIDPIGAGESAEINIQGHSRIYMGKNIDKNRSLTLNTAGGVETNWGFDNDKNRSWDATFRKAVSWNILGSDSDGISMGMRVTGDVRVDIEGSRYTEIRGSDIRLVHGIIEDKYLGKKVNHYVTDVNNTYGGKYVELTVGHHNQTFSTGISRTILAPNIIAGDRDAESTEIKLGNYKHKMLLGSKNEEILLGNHSSKVGIGNRSISVGVGNYSVKCDIGNIDIKTTVGSINVKTTTGEVTVEGSLGVKIKSNAKVTVDAPIVNIGRNRPLQGIVTGGPAGHRDYITGLPLVGSNTVKASAT